MASIYRCRWSGCEETKIREEGGDATRVIPSPPSPSIVDYLPSLLSSSSSSASAASASSSSSMPYFMHGHFNRVRYGVCYILLRITDTCVTPYLDGCPSSMGHCAYGRLSLARPTTPLSENPHPISTMCARVRVLVWMV